MYKALILLPEEIDDEMVLFPFLMALRSEFEEIEVNLLAGDRCVIKLLNLLPFELKVHKFTEENFTFSKNAQFAHQHNDIFNVTHYFNLRDDLNSAYLGRMFRAKERIGWLNFKTKLLYTHGIKKEAQSVYTDKSYVDLLSSLTGKNYTDLKIELEGSCDEGLGVVLNDIELDSPAYYLISKLLGNVKDRPCRVFVKSDKNEVVKSLESDFPQLVFLKDFTDQDIMKRKSIVSNDLNTSRLCCLYNKKHIHLTNDQRSIVHFNHVKMPMCLLSINEEISGYYINGNDEGSFSEPEGALDFILESLNL